ncbi:hypothetical protein [Amycolatopsis suaedae]|uniref:Uncharacterized protein n=1 Tax=Amycolatopsis suaedae TaxID=2510978 RepID=A0A4V2EL11_9PSEU|nr:hypothetical protein [Amycolatopsis suaedae]RZQ59945.1 hypothetical protein EWH70_31430 [Amycolatopsis suaedae]
MIARAVVVPQAPLLVPELAAGAAGETEPVRSACLRAVAALTEVSGDWTALAAGPPAVVGPPARGSLRGYGVDRQVSLSAQGESPAAELPLPALVAGWLREQAGARSVEVHTVDGGPPPPVGDALLVLGDGSNRHGPRAPGGEHADAPQFDAELAKALGDADPAALAAVLESGRCDRLGVATRPAWLAFAELAAGPAWHAELLYSDAPFGVGYHVAVWSRR